MSMGKPRKGTRRGREEGLEFVMFAGPGRFEIRDGRLQSAVPAEAGWARSSTINLGSATGAWSGKFTNPDSSLILVLKEATSGSHFLVRARDKQGEWHEVGRGSRSLTGNREFRQVSWRLPADGGPFEIEIIPQDPIVAEYWIRPPEGG